MSQRSLKHLRLTERDLDFLAETASPEVADKGRLQHGQSRLSPYPGNRQGIKRKGEESMAGILFPKGPYPSTRPLIGENTALHLAGEPRSLLLHAEKTEVELEGQTLRSQASLPGHKLNPIIPSLTSSFLTCPHGQHSRIAGMQYLIGNTPENPPANPRASVG